MANQRFFTRAGDDCSTTAGGARVPKDGLRVRAIGDVDELNSAIGAARAFCSAPVSRTLADVQNRLFQAGAELALPKANRIMQKDIDWVEKQVELAAKDLPEMRHFVLPGGSKGAALLHLARSTCRRAERSAVALSRKEDAGKDLTTFLNRLSSLLFVLALAENKAAGVAEEEWKGMTGD